MIINFLVLFLTGFAGLILASDPWTVTITPNSVATGESHWSLSGTNYVVGLQTGKVVYWSATINSTHPNATVKADTGNAVVTFKKGIFINFLDNEGDLPSYIFLTGDIVDSGTNYNITGAVIGEFGGKNKQ